MICVRVFVVLTLALCASAASTTHNNNNNDATLNAKEICALMPRGATILRPKSCTNWIKCPSTPDSNDYEEGSCVLGLYFNKDNGRCEYEDQVVCQYENSQERNRCERKSDGTFLADPAHCNGYIFCKNGQEVHSSCPSSLVFHPQRGECVYSDEYKCPEPSKKTSPLCHSIPNGYNFADTTECVKYSECINNTLVSHECDRDMAFDYVIGRCVKKDDVVCHPTAKEPLPENTVCGSSEHPRVGYFADENSCSSYYICAELKDGPDREPKHVQCKNGLFFDSATWSCRDRMNVKCTLDRCEGMGNKYVNIMGDCKSYARCANGAAIQKGTCPSDYYFDERTQGCTPHNVNYAACSA